jgi:hypothetical protein
MAGRLQIRFQGREALLVFEWLRPSRQHCSFRAGGLPNANPSPLFAGQQVLDNEKFAPFAKDGVS